MGLFGASSVYDADIEKATSENNTTEKWDLIMEICDKVGNVPANAKECLRSIVRRLNHTDPHVVVQAITLLDACVSNCGKSFHLEIASREFENEFKKLFQKTNSVEISTKLKMCLKRWAETEFKSDPQLNLIPSLYDKMKSEGHDFNDASKPIKREVVSKDPNVVSSQQEEEDIAKAIELSLKEAKQPTTSASPKTVATSAATTTASSLYPSMDLNSGAISNTVPEPRKVRALYDFEAAEDNELTFFAGEVLLVLDDADPNWWKGQNTRGEGLFPANFVTADLSAEPESLKTTTETKKKVVQFEQEKEEPPQINEDTIDRLLHLLHEADPEDPSQDTDEMMSLENMVNQMGPLIDAELDRVDRKHGQLSQLSADFAEAVTLYHSLMRDDRFHMHGGPSSMGHIPPTYNHYQHPPQGPMSYGGGNQYAGRSAGPPSSFHQNGLTNGPPPPQQHQQQHNSPLHHPQQVAAPGPVHPAQNFTPNVASNNFNHDPAMLPPQYQPNPAAPFMQNYSGPPSFIPQSQANNFPAPNQQQMMYQPPSSGGFPGHMGYHINHHQSPNHQPAQQQQPQQQQFQQTMIPGGDQMHQQPQFQQMNPGNIPLYQQR